jgi:hypothetical protein
MGLSFVGCHCVCFAGVLLQRNPTPRRCALWPIFAVMQGPFTGRSDELRKTARPRVGPLGRWVVLWLGRGWIVVTFGGDQWHLGKKTGQYDERDVADDVGRFEGNRRGK